MCCQLAAEGAILSLINGASNHAAQQLVQGLQANQVVNQQTASAAANQKPSG